MMRLYVVTLVAGIFLATNSFAGATDDVKKTVGEVIRIVTDTNLKKHEQQRRHALKKAISNMFDYSEMTKHALGKHWNQRTQAERNQLTHLFASLLESSYAAKIESYNNENILYLKETLDGNYAEIKTKVVTEKSDEYLLDYRLINENGKWMVYDVVIEGVSLVANYRAQFNKVITTYGYNELVKKLQAKASDL